MDLPYGNCIIISPTTSAAFLKVGKNRRRVLIIAESLPLRRNSSPVKIARHIPFPSKNTKKPSAQPSGAAAGPFLSKCPPDIMMAMREL